MATHLPTAPAPPVAAPGWSGQQHYPGPPPPPVRVGRRRGPIGLWILAGVAVVVSIAALALGVIAVATKPTPVQSAPTSATPAAAAPILFDDAADRPLCEALPDLMRESTSRRNDFIATPVDSPERKAAIPRFKAESEDWANRMQQVIATHSEPSRYLTRTLQRYVDDVLLYSQNVYPQRAYDKFDDATWNLAIVDYGGALGRCQQLGIKW